MKKQDIATFRQAAAYLDDIPRFTSKHSMEETRAFLHRLGDPDRGMRILHVAGTNGKGSVCACLRDILEEAGYRVALFTSPHLVDVRERFVVDKKMVSREDFLRAFLHIYDLLDWEALEREGEGAYHPTYFEYLFFMAMVLFPERHPDFCILETGVGGRLDATNAVGQKELAVITHISLDHTGVLGNTLGSIAREKAGILCKDAPLVYWDTCPETSAVFAHRAEELGISAYSVSEKDYSFSKFMRKTIDFYVCTLYDRDIPLRLHTIAAYQMENCALAVRAAQALDIGITDEQVQRGVEAFSWAGRMEEVLPGFYVDGAHNEDGIRAFLETVAADGWQGERTLLFGVMKDKDYKRMIQELSGCRLFHRIAVAHVRNERAVPAAELSGLLEGCGRCPVEEYENVPAAVRGLLTGKKSGERIYAAGSLYLVGEIKELLQHDQFRGRIEEIPSQP